MGASKKFEGGKPPHFPGEPNRKTMMPKFDHKPSVFVDRAVDLRPCHLAQKKRR
jgi:hypothetical protein